MAVVVEQTIPFAKEQLDVENTTRWESLYPLIRPSIQVISTPSGQTVLVDQTLANDKFVRVVVVGRAGNFSSKLLSEKNVTAVVTHTESYGVPSSLDLAKAINEVGHQQNAGVVVLRSGKERKLASTKEDVVEVEVASDLEVDHLIHLLGAATESTRSSIQKTKETLQTYLETSTTATSTFQTGKENGQPAVSFAEGDFGGYGEARHAIEKALEHVLRPHLGQKSDNTYSIHYSDINGLSRLENYILGLEIATYLKNAGLAYRLSTSTLLQHSNLARGFSISVCPISNQNLEAQQEPSNPLADEATEGSNLTRIDSRYMKFTDHAVRSRIENGCGAVIKEEATITRYDEIVGDGDCGYTLRDGAKQVLKFIANRDLCELPQTLSELVHDLEVNMGGTSGALYCIFLTSLSSALASTDSVAAALLVAMNQLLNYTRARLGDRTMLDCLIPFVETLNASGDVEKALAEAEKGVESTKNLEAKLGRSTYLDESATRGVPDPGAYGLLVLLKVKYCVLSFPTPEILLVTLNRPKQLNCISAEGNEELDNVWQWLDAEPKLCVGILTGTGRAFCAGADLKEWNQANASGKQRKMPSSGFGGLSRRRGRKPVIAAVNGICFGGGCEMAINSDMVFASSSATFSLPEVKRGVVAIAGALPRIARVVGKQRAMEMALTGRVLKAEEAREWGLVNRVVEGDVVAECIAVAKEIAGNSPDAVIVSREGVNLAWEGLGADAATEKLIAESYPKLLQGENIHEGVKAFVEKRKPVWKASKL
ncbi:Dak phosphatase [Aureobasidium subglaciale]|nr:Dak phosphatase [Aureobasidium subglaciale]